MIAFDQRRSRFQRDKTGSQWNNFHYKSKIIYKAMHIKRELSNNHYNELMNIRRYYYPGQIVFITQVLKDRKPIFYDPEMVVLLRETLLNVKTLHPFEMLAYVFLPDHFHIMIRPTGESNFSQIMHSLKYNFSNVYKLKINHIGSLSFWQKRFWDHVIRDETDLENHIHYIHNNPIKHGYVDDLQSWKNSSYSAWQERGLYDDLPKWIESEDNSWGE